MITQEAADELVDSLVSKDEPKLIIRKRDLCPHGCTCKICTPVSEDEPTRNHHRGTCFRVNEDYTKTLEQKLIDIECGECGKNMLVCRCDDKEE